MNDWKLTDEEKRALRDKVRCLDPYLSADREAMMVDSTCEACVLCQEVGLVDR